MSPAVSVVVATYNYGCYLAGALESALGQTFGDLEVVVVDDGSTDDTPAVLRPYLADPRVRGYRLDHLGQAAAKNVGVRLARAPLVAFLDADDLWLPEKLERQVALFRSDPGLGLVYAPALWIDGEGRPLERRPPALNAGDVLDALFVDNFVCFSSAVVRAKVFHEVGLFDEALPLAIDYELWLRVAAGYRFAYVDRPLVKYRTGHASLSRRLEERLETVTGIMRRFLDERGGRALLDPAAVRRAWAETHAHLGLVRRRRSRLAALPCYLRALAASPRSAAAWRGLVSLPVPERVRRWYRVARGRPADWSVRRPLTPACAAAGE